MKLENRKPDFIKQENHCFFVLIIIVILYIFFILYFLGMIYMKERLNIV